MRTSCFPLSYILPDTLSRDHPFHIQFRPFHKMVASLLLRVLSTAAFFTSFTLAQLSGSITFDGAQTLQVVIQNPSQSNLTIPGTNNLFDRQNLMAYRPITITNLTGAKLTLNGTEYTPPNLSDDVFQDIPPGGSYVRNLNVSEYILGETSQGLSLNSQSTCFIASLPPSVYALNTTGITSSQTIATYYLSKGLQTISITSQPFHFNYSVPIAFTTDQAAAIKNDVNVRRLAAQGVGINTRRRSKRRTQ